MRYGRQLVMVWALAVVAAVPAIAQTQKPTLDIMLMTKPSPPVTGKNTVEVMVKDVAGKPVTDGEVTVTFFMAAMPAMKMPEMKNSVTLKHVKDGTYSGVGQVMMAGTWDVTVAVKRGGKEIGSKKFPVNAK
jgi:nitrogen fixation protein FixH